MAGILDTLTSKLGVPGRKLYDTEPPPPTSFTGMALKEKLQSLVLHFRTVDREQRIRRHVTWYLMELYYRGYQNVDLNPTGSSFDVFEREDFYVENQFRKHVDTVKQILNKLEGDVVVRPASDNAIDLATARAADPILEMQMHDIDYDRLLDQKNLDKCLFGNAFIFTDYIADKRYGSIVTPKFSYEDVPDEMGGEPLLTKRVTGYQTRPRGKQVATVCSPLEINCPAEIKPFTEIPYLQWISRQDIELLNYLYPGLNISGGMSAVEVDLAQQYIDILSSLPGSILGDSLAFNRGSSMRKKAELVRSWLAPCTFRGDKELLNQFPDGVQITTINGKVVDYYSEDFRDRWTHEVLIPVPHSLLGDGLYDAILMQDQINEIDSLLIQHMRYTTVGHKGYNPLAVDPKDYANDPKNGLFPVKVGMDRTVSQEVVDFPPGTLSQDVGKWLGTVKMAMQDMTGAYDPVTGKGIGANTPYSQSVFLAERAQGRWQGSLSYNRPEMIRFRRQLLKDVQTNWSDMRQRAITDNTGAWSFQQFSQADLQGDFDIIMSNSDFKPRTRAEEIQGLQMLTTLVPLIPSLPPKQKLRIEEVLGLPPDANPTSGQISRAYRMIARIKKGEIHSPLPIVDDAQIQIPVFQDFLASEEGEALAESQPEIFSNVFTYMVSLMHMGMMQMSSPAGMLQRPMESSQKGQSPPVQSGTPGGQVGQMGGGSPNPEGQAQSPAPAPPITPPRPGTQI